MRNLFPDGWNVFPAFSCRDYNLYVMILQTVNITVFEDCRVARKVARDSAVSLESGVSNVWRVVKTAMHINMGISLASLKAAQYGRI